MAPNLALNQTRQSTQRLGAESPTKPPGILLTPGTATTRRKTVAWETAVVDNEEKAVGKSGIPSDCPGKFPSPWTPKVNGESSQLRKTALTKTLEAARQGKSRKSSGRKNNDLPTPKPLKDFDLPAIKEAQGEFEFVDSKVQSSSWTLPSSVESNNGDMTIDLNDPHSQSGRYWKSEYERYHTEAKAQMQKLVKYKQLAKSYAKKKDGEAIDLGEKLKEEQQKVSIMEEEINALLEQVAERNNVGEDESPTLMRDLARQTSITVQYRDKVDQFQMALQERNAELNGQKIEDEPRFASPRTAQTLIDTSTELKKARKQLEEMSSMRAEMHSLRLDLQAAEKKASRLQDENTKLSGDLSRVNSELKRIKRQDSADGSVERRDDSFQKLKEDYDLLKEMAKSQRRDAENLLKQRHDQVVGLKREIGSLKAAEKSTIDQVKPNLRLENNGGMQVSNKHEVLIAAEFKGISTYPAELISLDTPENDGPRRRVPTHTRLETNKRGRPLSRDGDSILDSKIPVLERPIMKLRKSEVKDVAKSGDLPPSNVLVHRKSQPVLGEITNNINAIAERPFPPYGKVQGNPITGSNLQERFLNLSLPSTAPVSPSLESTLNQGSHQAARATREVISPRPSMFNIASSPPKQVLPRPRSSENSTFTKNTNNHSSSRLGSINSTRPRIALPPDRAAAAKARLEQKRLENRHNDKKELQEIGDEKENLPS
jgi:hypothetical protein